MLQTYVFYDLDLTTPAASVQSISFGSGAALEGNYYRGRNLTLLRVASPVSLNNIPLKIGQPLTRFLDPGTVVTLIDYTGQGPIDGTFAGLPEGAELRARNGQRFRISYAVGTGNDVTLTALDHYSADHDFNGDGMSEILWRNTQTGENYRWTMNGYVHTSGAVINQVPDSNWKIAANADFDGDGDSDILWRHATTGDNYMYLMQNGVIASAGALDRVATDWQIAGAGDFNGDGKADIVWRNPVTFENYLYLMNGRTLTRGGPLRSVPSDWSIGGIGDVNADGMDDILWTNPTTSEVYLWQMNHHDIAGQLLGRFPGFVVAGMGPFAARTGYIREEADAKTHFVLRNETTGAFMIHLSGGTVPYENRRPFLEGTVDPAWKLAAIGDYNRDSVDDILWRHSVTGENYLYLITPAIANEPTSRGWYTGHALPPVPDTNWQIVR